MQLNKHNEKELKKGLGSGMLVSAINPTTQVTETCRSLNSRQAWSTMQVPEQQSQDSEGNNEKQKSGEDITEKVG